MQPPFGAVSTDRPHNSRCNFVEPRHSQRAAGWDWSGGGHKATGWHNRTQEQGIRAVWRELSQRYEDINREQKPRLYERE